MSHIDEGALHAYLDGALEEYPAAEAHRVREHVETCAVCADRLADERRIREQAQEILGLAAPHVEVPTFEELRAYVRRNEPARTTVSVRLYRLSWAASVVLALGTGWMLRGGQVDTTLVRGRSPVAESGRPAAGAERQSVARAADVAASDLESDAPSTEEVGAGLERSAPSESTGPAATVGQAGAPASGAIAAQAEPAHVAGSGASAFSDAAPRNEARGRAVTDVLDAVGQNAPADLAAVVPTGAATAARGVRGVAGGAPAPAAPAAASADDAPEVETLKVAEVQASADPQAAAARDADVTRRAAPEQRLASAVTTVPTLAAGLRARPDDAAADQVADDEAASLVVPGLEVLDVLPVGEGTTFAGMRALQRLQSGDTLELVHLPEGVAPASLPALRTGWSELVRPRGDGWLVMRARVPEATLAELLQRLEAGR
jgi:anti-sigma factor RsiW